MQFIRRLARVTLLRANMLAGNCLSESLLVVWWPYQCSQAILFVVRSAERTNTPTKLAVGMGVKFAVYVIAMCMGATWPPPNRLA